MSNLWIPPTVSRELQEKTRANDAELLSMFHTDGGILTFWTRALKRIDPRLSLAQAKENAEGPGIRPGYYHVLRRNEGAPMWRMPLCGPNGEFIEPTEQMLQDLEASDLQNGRAVHDRQRADAKAQAAKEAQKAQDTAERHEDLNDRLAAITKTRVSMTDVPWSQNVKGRRRK